MAGSPEKPGQAHWGCGLEMELILVAEEAAKRWCVWFCANHYSQKVKQLCFGDNFYCCKILPSEDRSVETNSVLTIRTCDSLPRVMLLTDKRLPGIQ